MTITTALRPAAVNDIIRRLTNTPYKTTAATPAALGPGMGDAQTDIIDALNDAIDAGLVRVVTTRDTTYGKNVRFVALADGIRYCQTCVTGCNHPAERGGDSCGHWGCWAPDSTDDCPGVAYGRIAHQHGGW